MTREEAKITLEQICSSAISDVLFEREAIALEEFVDKIYDKAEEKCDRCKHYVRSHNECVNDTENCYIEPHSKNFYCSLFERVI